MNRNDYLTGMIVFGSFIVIAYTILKWIGVM